MFRYRPWSSIFVIAGTTVLLSFALYRSLSKRNANLEGISITDHSIRSVCKYGRLVLNPWHFSTVENPQDEKQQVSELLRQIYTAPPEQQEELSRQLASQHKERAHFMWYEAFVTGHEMVAAAVLQGGKVALQGSNLSHDFEKSVQSHLDSVKEHIWQATGNQQRLLVEEFVEEYPFDRTQLVFDAAVRGQARIIETLLEIGVPTHLEEQPSLVPLHAACFNGNLECARVLNSSGISVDHADEFGATPLMRAATGGHTDIVQWLVDNGAQVNAKDQSKQEMNAIVFAAWHGHKEVVELLKESGSICTPALLSAAAYSGDIELYESVLDICNIPWPPMPTWQSAQLTPDQRTMLIDALEYAGYNNSPAIIRRTLEYLVPLHEERNAHGEEYIKVVVDALLKSLRSTVENDSVETARFILQFARERLFDETSSTDLRYGIDALLVLCAEHCSVKLAKYLIEDQGANVNTSSLPQPSALLSRAAGNGHVKMIELLVIDHGADIRQGSGESVNGVTALWEAVRAKQEWAVRKLLELGGPVDSLAVDLNDSLTSVYIAASDGDGKVILDSNVMASWLMEDSSVHFLCLEYPKGLPFLQQLEIRSNTERYKDHNI